jgi:hypothetical protein
MNEFMTINQELVKIFSSQVGVSNFRSNIQSHYDGLQVVSRPVSSCFSVNGLIGHPKDRGKYNLNSMTNSFQPEEIDARKNI